ncbi:MAG: transporter substrate-binding domain-containing protein, partial [Synergistaceae bacterium]|nr:transporter substrate-binding domain-containing protein [Synergistaceae bacterium]
MRRNFIILCIIALLAFSAAAFVLCGKYINRPDAAISDNSLMQVLKAKKLVLGLDANFPPMSFYNSSGDFIGFDVDMMKEVCSRLGIALITKPINWDAKEDELNTASIDCIGSMSVIPSSIRDMNLSESYIKEDLIFVVHGSSKAKWLRDLKGKRIGVQSGSTTQEALEALDIYKDLSAVLYDDNLAILKALKPGELDAGLVDSLTAYYFIDIEDNEQYFVLGESLGEEDFAIGFRKADKTLRDKVQEIISAMKADGTLGEISQKWFGSDITIV